MRIASKRAIVLILGLALVAAACGDDDTTSTASSAAGTASTEAPATTAAPATTEAPATTAAPATTEARATTAAPATTEAPATTAAPATTQAPATTAPAAMTPEEFVAEHNIPLPPDTELVSMEEVDGGTRIGAIVNATPPPGYAAMATAAGWTVTDVTFGSERTTATFPESVGNLYYCLIAYANYDSQDSVDYWVWFTFLTGLTDADCSEAAERVASAVSLLGRP